MKNEVMPCVQRLSVLPVRASPRHHVRFKTQDDDNEYAQFTIRLHKPTVDVTENVSVFLIHSMITAPFQRNSIGEYENYKNSLHSCDTLSFTLELLEGNERSRETMA